MGVEVRMGIAFVSINMDTRTPPLIILSLSIFMVHFILCGAQGTTRSLRGSIHFLANFHSKTERFSAVNEGDLTFQSSNTEPLLGVGSPFTLPPYDSLSPIPLPDSSAPYCTNPPSTPQTPSTTIPSPGYETSPPPPPFTYGIPPPNPIGGGTGPPSDQYSASPTPPQVVPGPTMPGFTPGSPVAILPSPPDYYYPPAFLPPVIYPAPAVPPPPNTGASIALWCVAKPSVPDPIIQEAMNYACGSGADCASIQPQGLCFQPNTLFAHASYAFNSYWQRTKVAGGTCSFGGTAILVTVDPSYDGCHFVYY